MQHGSASSTAASPQFTRPKVDTETTAQQPKPAEPLTPPATEKKGKAGTPAPAPAATPAPHHQAVSGSAEPLAAAQAASKTVATKAPCGPKTSAAVMAPGTTAAPGTLARVAPSSASVAAEQTKPVTAPQPSAGPPGPHPPAGAPLTPRHSQHPVKTAAPQSSPTPRPASTCTTSAIASLSLTSALDQSSVASPSQAPLEARAPASAQGAAKSNVAVGVEPTMSAVLQGRGPGAKPAAPAAMATPVVPHPSPAHPPPPPAKPDICSTPLIQPAPTPLIDIPAEPRSSPGSRSSSLFSADSVADFEAASSPGSPRSSLSPRQLVNKRPEAPRHLAPVISFSAAQGQVDLLPSASALALDGPTALPAPQLDLKPASHRPPRRNRHSGSVDGALPSFRPASCEADASTPQQQGGLQPDGAPASWFQLSLDLAKELELDPDFAQLGKGGRLPLGVDSPRPTSLRHSPGGSSVTTPALTTSPGPSPPRPLRMGQHQQQGGPQGGERPTPRLGPRVGAGGADVVQGERGGFQSFSPSSLPLPDSGWRPPGAAARKLPIPDPRQVILLAEPVTGREGLGGNTMPNAPRGRRRQQQQQQLGAGGEASAGRLAGAGQVHAGGLQPGLAMQRLDGTWVTLPPKPVEPGPGRTSPASSAPSPPSPTSAPQPSVGAGQQPPGQGPGPGQQGVSSPGAKEGGAEARGAGPHPTSPTGPQPWAGAGPSGGGGPGALPIVLTPVPGAGPDPWSGPGAGGWAAPLGAAGPSPAGGAAAADALGPGGCNVWLADQDPPLSSSGGSGEAAKQPADQQGGLGSGQGGAGGGAAAGSGGADQLTLTQAELGVSLLACAAGAEARLWAGARRPGQPDSPGPPPPAAAAHAVPGGTPAEQATGVVVANVPAAGPEPSNKPSSPSPRPSSSPKHKAAPPRPSSPNPAPALMAPHPPNSPAPSRDPRQLSTMAHRRPPSPIPDSSDGKCPKLPLVVPAPLPPPAACVIPAATSAPSHPGHTLNHTPLAGQQHHTTPATAGAQTWALIPAPAQRMADAANMTLPQDPHKALPGHQAPARAHLGPSSPSAMQAPSLVAHAKSDGAKTTVLPSLVKSGSGQREGAGVRLGCSSGQNDVMGLMRLPPAHAGPGGDNMF